MTLAAAVEVLHEQLRTPESDPSFFVADSGIYSEANIRRFNEAKIHWISRVPETSTQAKAVVEMAAERTQWQDSEDGQTHWFTQMMSLPQGQERLSSSCAPSRRSAGPGQLQAKGGESRAEVEAKALALVQPAFRPAWADAQNALARELKGLPAWLEVQSKLVSSEHHTGKGRPRKEAVSTLQWHIQATVTVKQPQVEQEVRTKACFIVATNVLDTAILSDQELVTTYKEQGSVERGFRFLRVSVVSGLFRVRQKAGAHRRAWLDHGAVLARLSSG